MTIDYQRRPHSFGREQRAYDQIILFGDSITQASENQEKGFGFAPALRDDYIRRVDVVNRGFSGYTSQLALKVLPQFMPDPSQANVRMMTLFFGANDATVPGNAQHVPLADYVACLEAMVLFRSWNSWPSHRRKPEDRTSNTFRRKPVVTVTYATSCSSRKIATSSFIPVLMRLLANATRSTIQPPACADWQNSA